MQPVPEIISPGLKQAGHGAINSYPSNIEVKNDLGYTFQLLKNTLSKQHSQGRAIA
jgi:hypothetical protein